MHHIMLEEKISEYVTLKIDEDDDVHIINDFYEKVIFVLPKVEALEVAEQIVKYFKKDN